MGYYAIAGVPSSELPALQGGVDFTQGGFYLGAWASTIKWIKDGGGDGNLTLAPGVTIPLPGGSPRHGRGNSGNYGGDNSGRFVNGVLSSVYKELQATGVRPMTEQPAKPAAAPPAAETPTDG